MNNKINIAMTTWDIKKDVTEYLKESLGLESSTGKKHIDDILDNAISKAKVEEKPEWTTLLLNNIKEDKIKDVTNSQTIFNIAAGVTDETLDKLVNVTPVKKETKIEELI
jgi:hypothetical protein